MCCVAPTEPDYFARRILPTCRSYGAQMFGRLSRYLPGSAVAAACPTSMIS